MTRKILTSNITWLLLGAFTFLVGKTLTGVPHTFSGMMDDKMLPFTFIAVMNFIMGGYVRARYWETGPDQKQMMTIVNWCSTAVCILLSVWLINRLF